MSPVIGRITSLQKTYGFIRTDDGVDYFFHDVDRVGFDVDLIEGDRVSFEIVARAPEKGPRAQRVAFLAGDAGQEV